MVSEASVSAVVPPPDEKVRQRRRPLTEWLEAYALLACLVVAAGFFAVYGPTADTFLTPANLRVLIGGQSVVAMVAVAFLVPLCAGHWDLSAAATAGLSAVFAASVMSEGSLVTAVIVALALGLTVGVANAAIVTTFKLSAVITTLGMLSLIAGVINMKTGGVAIVSNIPESLIDLGTGTWGGIPRIAVVVLAVMLATMYLLEHTPYGRYLYALGENPTAARLVGLRTNRLSFSTFVIAGLLASIGGILAVARSGGASPQLGDQLLLPALAAAFLSAASIKPGRYNVLGLLVAVYFLAVINNGLNLAGAQPYVSSFVNGGALIVGVGMSNYLGWKRSGA